MAESFDVVVIGGGAVGENAAGRAVEGGLSAALVESELFGGECSYWACMPSKALLRPGHALAAAKRVPGAGVTGELDPAAVFARRDAFTSHWKDDGQVRWAEGAGITPLRGHARITGEREITVGDKVITANHAVVVATGSKAVTPDIPGLDTVPAENVWYSREATSASTVPRRLLVLGGGVVGVEMAQAWARLGAAVTLVVRGKAVLPKLEPFVGELVGEGLRSDGVDLRTGAGVAEVSAAGEAVSVTLTTGDVLEVDRFLIATGRIPNTDDVGLDAIGLRPGDPLWVDDSGQVRSVEGGWLYAVGDVTGRAPLTHQGKYDARIAGDAIAVRAKGAPTDTAKWGKHSASADYAAVPQVVFTDPEVASVGPTLDESPGATAVDVDIAVAGSSLQADGYTGKARLVVDPEREVIIGATFVGQDVAELLHAATIAVVGEIPMHRLWHAVPAYPTISEVWLRLMEKYGL